MNILYLADPNSIHDQKWISFFAASDSNTIYILPRYCHHKEKSIKSTSYGAILLPSISDFSIVRFYKTVLTAVRIFFLVRKNGIDLIHILYAEPNGLWCLFRKFFKVPLIISCRGTDVLKSIPQAFERKNLINRIVAVAYKRAFLSADWITCTSKRQIKSVSIFSGRTNRISIVRTGVDLELLQPPSQELNPLLAQSKYILFPRYIRPNYNHEFCFEAIQLLPIEIKKEYKMVLIGRNSGDPLYQDFLEKQMAEMEDVEFFFLEKQEQRDIISLYKNASLVVMTPKSDGSPVSAMETLLCNTRLILGPVEYDDEIFSENVMRISSWNAKELADRIIQALAPGVTKQLPEDVAKLMDRSYNMSKLNQIYLQVTSPT